ncbi:MAG: type IV toxin-antitoxin system AbiEi family antitoxin domain-containing protein, partial [Muribaculaceae bacterium]
MPFNHKINTLSTQIQILEPKNAKIFQFPVLRPLICKISAINFEIAEILCIFVPSNRFMMNKCSQDIMNFAHTQPQFRLHELYASFEGEGNTGISRKTVSWYLTKLIEAGDLQRVAHGKYAIRTKQQFVITPTDEQLSLNDELKRKWQYARFCIYNGSIISPLQHHLSANNITYIETEREAVTAVFNYLRDNGKSAYLRPSRELIYNYIDLSQPSIFVKPLIT